MKTPKCHTTFLDAGTKINSQTFLAQQNRELEARYGAKPGTKQKPPNAYQQNQPTAAEVVAGIQAPPNDIQRINSNRDGDGSQLDNIAEENTLSDNESLASAMSVMTACLSEIQKNQQQAH